MGNSRYAYANERFLSGQLNWLAQPFRVALVDTAAYTPNFSAHHTLADIPAPARLSLTGPLTGKTATSGTARADNITVGPVYGPIVGALVVYHDSGTESTSELVAYFDSAHGLPVNPQGGLVTIHWDTGPNGIFTI